MIMGQRSRTFKNWSFQHMLLKLKKTPLTEITIFKNSGKPQLLYKLETWHEEVDVKGKTAGAVAPSWGGNLESL